MDVSRKKSVSLMLLLCIVAAPFAEELPQVDAKCDKISEKFVGYCFRSSKCNDVCVEEGYTNGKCKAWFFGRRCTCCSDPETSPSPEYPVEPKFGKYI